MVELLKAEGSTPSFVEKLEIPTVDLVLYTALGLFESSTPSSGSFDTINSFSLDAVNSVSCFLKSFTI